MWYSSGTHKYVDECFIGYRPTTLVIIRSACHVYRIMTEQLVNREIRIDEAAGRCNSDSRMTSFDVIK